MEIQFENLSKRYGKKYALRDFSATLENGVYGLLGANGAGKTTLINMLVGVLSGGMRQRVGIVQAMLNDPALPIAQTSGS